MKSAARTTCLPRFYVPNGLDHESDADSPHHAARRSLQEPRNGQNSNATSESEKDSRKEKQYKPKEKRQLSRRGPFVG
ncbi:unnamed protein product [Alternaria alternata]